MKFEFENCTSDLNRDDFDPKFAIDWFHYNHKPNDEFLKKRNRTRTKLGMPEILDNGHYFCFRIYFGKRLLGIYVTIRGIRLAESKIDQDLSIEKK